MKRSGLAIIHEGEDVITAKQRKALAGDGLGGLNVAINVSAGSGLDMTADQFEKMVAGAAGRLFRSSGGFRGLVKDTARSGL